MWDFHIKTHCNHTAKQSCDSNSRGKRKQATQKKEGEKKEKAINDCLASTEKDTPLMQHSQEPLVKQ